MVKIRSKDVSQTDRNIHLMSIADLEKKLAVDVTQGVKSARAEAELKKHRLEKAKIAICAIKVACLDLIGIYSLFIWLKAILMIVFYTTTSVNTSDVKFVISICLIFICVFFKSILRGFQEYTMIKSLRDYDESRVGMISVLRDSKWSKISANELVIGDIVSLVPSQHVPADLRLISADGLLFDKSILTGNNLLMEANANDLEGEESANVNYYEAKNMAFKNFWVASGTGRGIVVSIGDKNKMMLSSEYRDETRQLFDPVKRALNRIGIITFIVSIICVAVFLIFWATYLRTKYNTPVKTVLFCVFSIIVTGLPYSLPISISLGLLIQLNSTRKSHILVKNALSLVSMNLIDVIVADKSGTITRNLFQVTNVFVGGKEVDLEKDVDSSSPAFSKLLKTVEMLMNTISINPNEHAMLRFVNKYKWPDAKSPKKFYKVAERLDFITTNIYQCRVLEYINDDSGVDASLSDVGESYDSSILGVAGMPEFLVSKCKYMLAEDGNKVRLDDDTISRIQSRIEKWGSLGQKIIVFAKKTIDKEEFEKARADKNYNYQKWFISQCSNFTMIGMLGLVDPPQPGIRDTVSKIKDMNMRMILVTGDFGPTSASMALQTGLFYNMNYDTLAKYKENQIISNSKEILLHGSEIESMSKEEFNAIYSNYTQIVVFRANPNQKVRVVKLLQENKHSVLMVGDGLNDISALKQANLSIAMNCGPKLATDVADIVLLNNSFSSVYDLLSIGRKNLINTRKAMGYCLVSSTVNQIISSFISSILGLPQLYSTFQMVLMSTSLDTYPAVSLLFEKPDSSDFKIDVVNSKIFDKRYLILIIFIAGPYVAFCAYLNFFIYFNFYTRINPSDLLFSIFIDASRNSDPHIIVAQSIVFYTITVVLVSGILYSIRTRFVLLFESLPIWGPHSNYFLVASSISVYLLVTILVSVSIPGFTMAMPFLFYFIPFAYAAFIIFIFELVKTKIIHSSELKEFSTRKQKV